jgi:hypothetical protein
MILTHGANSLARGVSPIPQGYTMVKAVYLNSSDYPNMAFPTISNPKVFKIKTYAENYSTNVSGINLILATNNYNNWIRLSSYANNDMGNNSYRFNGTIVSKLFEEVPDFSLNGAHEIVLDGVSEKFIVDGVDWYQLGIPNYTFSDISPLRQYNGISNLGISECVIEDGLGNELLHFVAARRDADSAVGFYFKDIGFLTSSSYSSYSM